MWRRTHLLAVCAGLALARIGAGASGGAAEADDPRDVGLLVRSLWLVHRHGTRDAVDPRNDERVKAVLARSLARHRGLTAEGVADLMTPETFSALAGGDGVLDPAEIRQAQHAEVPALRRRLFPRIAAYAEELTTSFDRIDEPHRAAAAAVVDWIVAHYEPGRPLEVMTVCTANSRRSFLGAAMGNVAAAYYGLPEVRFFCGGTEISALNPRTADALRGVGFEVEPTGAEAPRGDPALSNPVYRLRWGRPAPSSDQGPALEALEFSKRYSDPSNPRRGFAALMVCGEADAACPIVAGASLRVSLPYLDPKIYDGSAFEAAKYAERRDDLGRLMLAIVMQARQRLAAAGKLR
jgi:hypothetical protein